MFDFTVSFFGHRQINDPIHIERALEELIRTLMTSKETVVFLVGRDGAFDQLVSAVIHRCKRYYSCELAAHILILPYATAEYKNNTAAFHEYYDDIEICLEAENSHFKAAHQIRNRAMVDRSDLVVFCVDHSSGGAYQTMRYAEKTGVKHINLAIENQ